MRTTRNESEVHREGGARREQKSRFSSKTNRRMEYKDKKFGFGGQKKNSKRNTADSSADVLNKTSSKWQRPSFHAQKGKKVGVTDPRLSCSHRSIFILGQSETNASGKEFS